MPRTNVDFAVSREMEWKVQAENGQCYRNAYGAIKRLSNVPGARYVEGWVVWDDLQVPFEHGWLELPDGTIVDPTPAYCNRTDARTYFGGYHWTATELRDHCIAILRAGRRVTLPLWERIGAHDPRHITAARVQASIPQLAFVVERRGSDARAGCDAA